MATIVEFSNILKNKIDSKNSANLYVLTYHEQIHNFDEIVSVLKSKIVGNGTFENPDFLTISRDIKEEEKDYRMSSESFKKFFEFIKYRPINSSKKVVLIRDAHLISEVLCNKLLKTFEESPEYLITILCMPHQHTLISTIISRAITIRLDIPKDYSHFNDLNSELDFGQLQLLIKKNPTQEVRFIEKQINSILDRKNINYSELNDLLISLKNYDVHKDFNGPINSRLATLIP